MNNFDSIFDKPETCMDELCPVHERNDMVRDGGESDYVAITYVGEYCVLTDVESLSAMSALAVLLGLPAPDLDYQTSVYCVGFGGCLVDAAENGPVVLNVRHGSRPGRAKRNHEAVTDLLIQEGLVGLATYMELD